MSSTGSSDRGGEGSDGEVVHLVRELRAQLGAITDGELRRQARLTAFDKHITQMESSIHGEVDRLRSTGAAIELLTDQLRESQSADSGDRLLEPIREQLAQLRDGLARLPTPDDQPVLAALSELAGQLNAVKGAVGDLSRDDALSTVADLLTEVGSRVEALVIPDLQPVQSRLDQLRSQIEALPAPDLDTVEVGLQTLQDRLDAIPQPDLGAIHATLAEVRQQITDLPTHDDQPTLAAVRELADRMTSLDRSVAGLASQELLDGIASTVSNLDERLQALVPPSTEPLIERLDQLHARVAAIPARDLRPLHDQLDQVRSLIGALPVADDTALLLELAAVQEQLASLPQPDLSPLHERLTLLQDQLASLPEVDLAPLHQQLDTLRQTVDALPQPNLDAAAHEILRLTAELDSLRTSMADRFDALPVLDLEPIGLKVDDLRARVADVPGVDQLAQALAPAFSALREAVDPAPLVLALDQTTTNLGEQLSALSKYTATIRERIEALPDDTDRLETLATSGRAAQAELVALTEAVAGIADQTTPISAMTAGLVDVRTAISTLEAMAQASMAASHADADGQALALARVTAAADGLAASLGALRAEVGSAIDAASQATVTALDDCLRQLDPQPLQARLEEVEQLLRSFQTDSARTRDGVAAVAEDIGRLSAVDLAPVEAALELLTERVSSLPTPDLGPVAAQLARLTATIASETRVPPAGAAALDELGVTLTDAMIRVLEQLDRQSALADSMATQLAALPSTDAQRNEMREERRGELRSALDARQQETTDALGTIASELAENMQRELDAMKGQLASLADGVERAAVAAELAAQSAQTALRTVEVSASRAPAEPAGKAQKKAVGAAATTKTAATKKPPASAASTKTPPKTATPADAAAPNPARSTPKAKPKS